jgi:PBP1b-binding outer membrane lipoprotein LpoB
MLKVISALLLAAMFIGCSESATTEAPAATEEVAPVAEEAAAPVVEEANATLVEEANATDAAATPAQ